MDSYEHTQKGSMMWYALGGAALIAAVIGIVVAIGEPVDAVIPLSVMLVLAMALLLFFSLTVSVSSEAVCLRYGIGWIHKRFAVADIEGATVVRNRWWYGWGVKLTPHGWLYNVSGLDAVELQLASGRKVRIGTDEPEKLLAAIESVIGKAA